MTHDVTLTPVMSDNWDADRSWTLRTYESRGGYSALRKALTMAPDDVITVVKDSGLRGRGGAGFPTGMKWGFIPQGDDKPHYLVVNADEAEPGTCKDIPLMLASPHTLIEGVIISPTLSGPASRSSTSAVRCCTSSAGCSRRSPRRTGPVTSVLTSAAPGMPSTSSSTPAPAPTSAVRRRRCWTLSRVAAGNHGCGHPSPQSPACTPARR